MKIEIVKFLENSEADSSVVGHVLVDFSSKMTIWFKLVKSKKGVVFCVPPSIKIDRDYQQAFFFRTDQRMKELCFQVLEETRKKYKLPTDHF